MYRNFFALAIAAAFLLTACANSSQNQPNGQQAPPTAPVTQALGFELKKDSLIKPTLEVRLHYFQATGANSEAINKHISTLMGEFCVFGEEASKMQVTTKSIFAALEKEHKENFSSDMAGDMSWGVEFFMSKAYTGKNVTSLRFDNYGFMGGAHPNSYSGFVNIDNTTGKILNTADLYDEAKLKPIVEKAFQTYWKEELQGSKDYEAKGFFVEKNQLPLPAQVGFGETGGIFYYNTYEVAAYVMGPTALEIPYSELKAALKIEL